MRIIVAGLGVQGRKRQQVAAAAAADVVATVDPAVDGADYRALDEVPLDTFDAAMLCLPDSAKLDAVEYLLASGKHVLVEKPLVAPDDAALDRIAALARDNGVVCYTAYNHRFEPHIVRLRETLRSGRLGTVYHARFFYGNGTARDVRESLWRDTGGGVIVDLGSHLLDMVSFVFDAPPDDFRLGSARRFENRAPDHAVCTGQGPPFVELEMSLVSWRNHFSADIYGEHGSAHIDSLCKWGPSSFTERRRVLPSGRPAEDTEVLEQPDPTWALEYEHFRAACADGAAGNTANDLWINRVLNRLIAQADEDAGP